MHAATEMSASTVNIASENGLQGQNHTIGGGRPPPYRYILCFVAEEPNAGESAAPRAMLS